MSQFVNMFRVDLDKGPTIVCVKQLFYGDVYANRIGAIVQKNGVDFALGGGTCAGTVIRADGSTVALSGTVSGNEAYVDLPEGAYAVIGQTQIFVTHTLNGTVTTLVAASGNVRATETGNVIEPGTPVGSVADLIAAIEAAVADIPSSDMAALMASIAPTFSASTAYTAGDYVFYSGTLYRFTADHAAGSWTGTDVVAAAACNGIASLDEDFGAVFEKHESTNLWNPDVTVSGKLNPSDGTKNTDTDYVSSDFMPCKNGDTIYEVYKNLGENTIVMVSPSTGNGATICIYNAAKEFIRGYYATNWTVPYTISDANAAYIRVSIAASHFNNAYRIYGIFLSSVDINTFESYYAPYYELESDVIVPQSADAVRFSAQTLTDAQKATARGNIDAASIGDVKIGLLNFRSTTVGNITTTISNAENGQTLITYDGSKQFNGAHQWAVVAMGNDKLAGKKFILNRVRIKWSGDSDYSDITSESYAFINSSFTFTGAAYLSQNTLYDLDNEFSAFVGTAYLYVGYGTTSTNPHVHLSGSKYVIDAFELLIDALVIDSNAVAWETLKTKYITCWGDSLTAQGGWTTELATLAGMTVHNCGIGGEGMDTIASRQGADALLIEGITIPATTTEVLLATRAEGFKTQMGASNIRPLLQGGGNEFNPCVIGGIKGTMRWTGQSYSDQNGTWVFGRETAGTAKTITRPDTIISKSDIEWNDPWLMIIFMGQNNFGYDNTQTITGEISDANIKKCIKITNWMKAHAKADNVVVLGIATGNASSNANYEAAMKEAFGRYFVSVREYLVHPVYSSGAISNCWGLQDLGLTASSDDLTDIAAGKVPGRCFKDGVHFVDALKPYIGQYIYKRCQELNIF